MIAGLAAGSYGNAAGPGEPSTSFPKNATDAALSPDAGAWQQMTSALPSQGSEPPPQDSAQAGAAATPSTSGLSAGFSALTHTLPTIPSLSSTIYDGSAGPSSTSTEEAQATSAASTPTTTLAAELAAESERQTARTPGSASDSAAPMPGSAWSTASSAGRVTSSPGPSSAPASAATLGPTTLGAVTSQPSGAASLVTSTMIAGLAAGSHGNAAGPGEPSTSFPGKATDAALLPDAGAWQQMTSALPSQGSEPPPQESAQAGAAATPSMSGLSAGFSALVHTQPTSASYWAVWIPPLSSSAYDESAGPSSTSAEASTASSPTSTLAAELAAESERQTARTPGPESDSAAPMPGSAWSTDVIALAVSTGPFTSIPGSASAPVRSPLGAVTAQAFSDNRVTPAPSLSMPLLSAPSTSLNVFSETLSLSFLNYTYHDHSPFPSEVQDQSFNVAGNISKAYSVAVFSQWTPSNVSSLLFLEALSTVVQSNGGFGVSCVQALPFLAVPGLILYTSIDTIYADDFSFSVRTRLPSDVERSQHFVSCVLDLEGIYRQNALNSSITLVAYPPVFLRRIENRIVPDIQPSACPPQSEWRYSMVGAPDHDACYCPANRMCSGPTFCSVVPRPSDSWAVKLVPSSLCSPSAGEYAIFSNGSRGNSSLNMTQKINGHVDLDNLLLVSAGSAGGSIILIVLALAVRKKIRMKVNLGLNRSADLEAADPSVFPSSNENMGNSVLAETLLLDSDTAGHASNSAEQFSASTVGMVPQLEFPNQLTQDDSKALNTFGWCKNLHKFEPVPSLVSGVIMHQEEQIIVRELVKSKHSEQHNSLSLRDPQGTRQDSVDISLGSKPRGIQLLSEASFLFRAENSYGTEFATLPSTESVGDDESVFISDTAEQYFPATQFVSASKPTISNETKTTALHGYVEVTPYIRPSSVWL